MALTATATINTRCKIVDKLKLNKPFLVKESSYKKNLSLFVKQKSSINFDIDDIESIIIKNGIYKKCIIYCKTKNECEKIASKLQKKEILCDFYHAGLSCQDRDIIQSKFKNNEINVITATIAFGMGIDIPDIYLIIHYGISKNIESYYQEIGRGGRDGSDVNCYVFWGPKDFITNKYFIKNIKNEEFRIEEYNKLNQLNKYIVSKNCRMKFLCKYFDDNIDDCNKCDNCLFNIKKKQILNKRKELYNLSSKSSFKEQTTNNIIDLINKYKIDSSEDSDLDEFKNKPIVVYDVSANKCLKEDIIVFRYFILKLFNEINKGLGMTNLIKILKGKIKEYKFCSVYGVMKNYKNEDVKNYIRKINHSEFISRKNIPNSMAYYYCINEFGINWLKYNKLKIENSVVKLKLLQNKIKKYINENFKNKIINTDKYKNLIQWRNNLSKKINKPTYCVINNKTLELIIKFNPKNKKELLKIKGIGPKKLEKYGDLILNLL